MARVAVEGAGEHGGWLGGRGTGAGGAGKQAGRVGAGQRLVPRKSAADEIRRRRLRRGCAKSVRPMNNREGEGKQLGDELLGIRESNAMSWGDRLKSRVGQKGSEEMITTVARCDENTTVECDRNLEFRAYVFRLAMDSRAAV